MLSVKGTNNSHYYVLPISCKFICCLSFCRAEANAKNYRHAEQEKLDALLSAKAAQKELSTSEKKLCRHQNKSDNIMTIKRELNVAQACMAQLKRELEDTVTELKHERARYFHKLSVSYI